MQSNFMVHPDTIKDITDDVTSLWLIVTIADLSSVFEFPAGQTRPITVGAAAHADVRVRYEDAPPMVCYIEREGDSLWLVPAYRSQSLRCDASLVERPRQLWRRSVIELPGHTISVRIRQEPPTCPNFERPRSHPGDWGEGTHAASGPLQQASSTALRLDGTQTSQGAPPSQSGPVSCEAKVLSSGPNETGGSAATLGAIMPSQIVAIERTERPADSEPGRVRSEKNRDERGLFYSVASLAEDWAAETAPPSTSPAVVSIRAAQRRGTHPLALLGEFAKRRPTITAIGASLGSFILFVVMTGISRLATDSQRTRWLPTVASFLNARIAAEQTGHESMPSGSGHVAFPGGPEPALGNSEPRAVVEAAEGNVTSQPVGGGDGGVPFGASPAGASASGLGTGSARTTQSISAPPKVGTRSELAKRGAFSTNALPVATAFSTRQNPPHAF